MMPRVGEDPNNWYYMAVIIFFILGIFSQLIPPSVATTLNQRNHKKIKNILRRGANIQDSELQERINI